MTNGHHRPDTGKRKSQIIEEEEEDDYVGRGGGGLEGQDEEEEIEEVDAFPAVQLGRGERVQSITILDDDDDEVDEDVFNSRNTTRRD